MKAVSARARLRKFSLLRHLASLCSQVPANAQKQGGSITVGLELDIPGFDPLKVGVFDTSAEIAAAAIFDTLITLDDKGEATAEARAVLDPFGRLQDLDIQAAAGRQISDGTPFNAASRTRQISTGRRIRPTNAAAPSTSPTSTTCRRPTN